MNATLKKTVWTGLRVGVILAGLGYILWSIQWSDDPETGRLGMTSLVRAADPGWLLGGFLVLSVIFPLQAWRWHGLLACRGLDVSRRSVLRLVMVGLFFNFCVPVGSNGGDVAKAYGAARGVKTPGSRATAVVSVLLDRVTGLLGLVLLAAILGPMLWGSPVGQKVTLIAWSGLVAVLVGGGVYLWPVTRKWLGVDLATKLSVVEKLDAAVTGYRHHGGVLARAVAVSLPVHLAIAVSTAMAGYAIGVTTPWLAMVGALPIVFLVGALPLTFMGLGVMEPTAFALLATDQGASKNQIIAMLMAWRLFSLIYALGGGALLLGKGIHLHERETDGRLDAAEAAAAENPAGAAEVADAAGR
ncbi:MAG: lysylphosphatidylglycerol synthase transmembrane domain-containing protein [Planctomycetota bacterium]